MKTPLGPLLQRADLDSRMIQDLVGSVDVSVVEVRLAPRWLRHVWRDSIAAMTWGRNVLVADPSVASDRVLLLHELVHVRQWQQTGALRFLWRYLADYLRGRISGLSHDHAYRSIRYEAEARRIASRI